MTGDGRKTMYMVSEEAQLLKGVLVFLEYFRSVAGRPWVKTTPILTPMEVFCNH